MRSRPANHWCLFINYGQPVAQRGSEFCAFIIGEDRQLVIIDVLLQCAPDRKFKIRGRSGFAFSDVRRIIAEAALGAGFSIDLPIAKAKTTKFFRQSAVTHGCLKAAGFVIYRYTGNFSRRKNDVQKKILLPQTFLWHPTL